MQTIRIVHCYRPTNQGFEPNNLSAVFEDGLKATKTLAHGYAGGKSEPFHLVSVEEFGTILPENDTEVRYRIVAIYTIHEDVAAAHLKLINGK
jgi:hypothetical protein